MKFLGRRSKGSTCMDMITSNCKVSRKLQYHDLQGLHLTVQDYYTVVLLALW